MTPPDTTTETATDDSEATDTDLLDEVELLPIDDLTPYVNNPKEHPTEQVKKIASSIRNFGWDQPIVVDADNEIIKGHGRYEAAKHLGLTHVPVIVHEDISKEDARASRIADNRVSESEWQDDALLSEVTAIETTGYTVEDLGFEADELDDLMDDTGWDDDLGMDSLTSPSSETDTTLALTFDEADYDDVLDWFDAEMAEHDLDSREDVVLRYVDGGE